MVFLPQRTGLSGFRALTATVFRPDGTQLKAKAYKAFVFLQPRPVHHREAFVLRGIDLKSVPKGSSIEIRSADRFFG